MTQKSKKLQILFILLSLLFTLNLGAQSSNGFVTLGTEKFLYNGQPVNLKGNNYYPMYYPWAAMWSYDYWSTYEADAQRLKDLGVNSIRILVPYSNGGWNGANVPQSRIDLLRDIINLFGQNGIRSVVTLFDWETSFPAAGTTRESDHRIYLGKIVNALKNNRYVIAWDLKNEPDHPSNLGNNLDSWDGNPAKRDQIISWYIRMKNHLRTIDTNHPVSIGLRWYTNVKDILPYVDFAIFHSYYVQYVTWQDPALEIDTVRGYMGANRKPILIEEFGWPSNGWHPSFNEETQRQFYEYYFTVFEQKGIAGGLNWQAYDFSGNDFEAYFGLWRLGYSQKPAYNVYKNRYPVMQFPLDPEPDTIPPLPVTNFKAVSSDRAVLLSWQNSSSLDYKGTMIRYKTTGYPTSVTDGTLVVNMEGARNQTQTFAHTNLVNGQTYYYSAFSYDYSNNYSGRVTAYDTPQASTTKIAQIKFMPDGANVSLSGVTVTASFPDDLAIYVQEMTGLAGIRVYTTNASNFIPGDVVNVTGTLRTRNITQNASIEREINSSSVLKIRNDDQIKPVAMGCLSIGGADLNQYQPGAYARYYDAEKDIIYYEPAIGPNNIGMLIKITGVVTRKLTTVIHIDDGSELPDIPGRIGVLVQIRAPEWVSVGDVVSVTGIVVGSVPSGWTNNRRCVKAVSNNHIIKYGIKPTIDPE
ncbi:MAG: hypothetical protein SNJ70_04005 [Armatimonadota bacterium]